MEIIWTIYVQKPANLQLIIKIIYYATYITHNKLMKLILSRLGKYQYNFIKFIEINNSLLSKDII